MKAKEQKKIVTQFEFSKTQISHVRFLIALLGFFLEWYNVYKWIFWWHEVLSYIYIYIFSLLFFVSMRQFMQKTLVACSSYIISTVPGMQAFK